MKYNWKRIAMAIKAKLNIKEGFDSNKIWLLF
jgi:hypothetical protein